MMNEHRSPDELSSENALICEKLLGWQRRDHNGGTWWELPSPSGEYAPSQFKPLAFTTWAEAGLILEKLDCFDIYHTNQYWTLAISAQRRQGMTQTVPRPFEGHSEVSGPLAIRAAALAYIKEMK